ncbi:type II toxin-antitoxin system RelE/ParE family toxin [Streptomyces sp. NPDC001508]|uniref:type II toxin-antitoxin system RelE family toxin n=1 Tax=Streptomyces sp. NPDC001508 TaxID=3154656 RepID=UPI0033187135
MFAATDRLASEPRPPGATAYGSRDLRRMRVGRYRIPYEITERTVTVTVLHFGRSAGRRGARCRGVLALPGTGPFPRNPRLRRP